MSGLNGGLSHAPAQNSAAPTKNQSARVRGQNSTRIKPLLAMAGSVAMVSRNRLIEPISLSAARFRGSTFDGAAAHILVQKLIHLTVRALTCGAAEAMSFAAKHSQCVRRANLLHF